MKLRHLSHQIVLVSVIVILGISTLSGLAMTILAQRIVTDNIIRGQHDLAASLSDHILFELGSNLEKLDELPSKSAIKSMEPASITNELRRFQSGNPNIANLFMSESTGRQIARSDFNPLVNVSSITGFQESLQGKVHISDLSRVILSSQYQQSGNTSLTRKWQDSITVSVFIPVIDANKVTGVIGADIYLFRIQPLLEILTFTHNETVMVLSQSGTVVAHSRETELGKLPGLSAPQLLESLELGQTRVPQDYIDEMDRNVKGVIHPIGLQGWSVVLQTPVSEIAQEVSGLWRLWALILVGSIALTVAIAWLMASRLTRPLSQLVQATEQVGAGELNTRVETNASNELGTLADSFNRMVSELGYTRARNQQLLDELKQLNEGLEQRVKQRTEDLHSATEQAKAANRAKSNFVANLSHELRVPLTSVIGFSEALLENKKEKHDQKLEDYIKYIHDDAKYMTSLITQIIDLEKMESGSVEIEKSKIIIQKLVENSISMLEEKATNHHIKIELQLAPKVDELEITADEHKLQQVLINLLNNAIMFTPDNGHVMVKLAVKDKQLVVEVVDTGIGITSENQEKVFEDFFQVDSGIKDKTPGLGLGLGLSRRLVEMHGGKIWVESEGENKGSHFIFTIPSIDITL